MIAGLYACRGNVSAFARREQVHRTSVWWYLKQCGETGLPERIRTELKSQFYIPPLG